MLRQSLTSPIFSYSEHFGLPSMVLPVETAIQLNMQSNLNWLFAGDPCPFCGKLSLLGDINNETCKGEESLVRQLLRVCAYCGWWIIEDRKISEPSYETIGQSCKFAKRCTFEDGLTHAPIDAIRAHYAKVKTARELCSRAFEQLVGAIISDFYNAEVVLTGHTKDGGIDMYSVICDRPWAFQVKRRQTEKPEGVEPVREFIGALVESGNFSGMFISSANRFTKGAIDFANSENLAISKYEIKLIDGQSLMEMFQLKFHEAQCGWKEHWLGNVSAIQEKIFSFHNRGV